MIVAQQILIMRDSIDTLRQDMNALKTQSAVQENKLVNLERQLESRDLWLRGIGIAIITGIVLWCGKKIVDIQPSQTVNPVSESISKAK
jgi:amino acid permease